MWCPPWLRAAQVHGKARKARDGETPGDYALRARDFALNKLLPVLASGELGPVRKRQSTLNTLADFIGLPRSVVRNKGGRIQLAYFVKNLLREEGRHIGQPYEPNRCAEKQGHPEALRRRPHVLHMGIQQEGPVQGHAGLLFLLCAFGIGTGKLFKGTG